MAGPSGTVTFLFTDIEGSTRLWQLDEVAMRAAVARHDELLGQVVAGHGGTVFSTMGDGVAAVFISAASAVAAALAIQELLGAETWPTASPIRVRMGLHTGEAEQRGGDYFGTAVNRAARLMAVGHGGQVLCSAVTAGLVDSELPLLDLGEHRLRDLDRPLRVFQAGDGMFAPLRSLDALPGNLPLQLTSFVGRQEELVEVAEALASWRLVTLTGVGGVGKTRLGLHAAADVLPEFADGAWLCELAAVADADGVVQVVAATFGLAQRPGLTLEQTIRDYLRSKHALVVLDNCEHVLRAAGAFAQGLLADCPRVRILATSREGLAIPGEQVRPLRSLDVPDRDGGSGSAWHTAAVRLFLDRVQAATGEQNFDPADVGSVMEICRRLDGIPLAIELAAARAAVMTPAEIAGLLEERFRLLTGGRRTVVERHQTLRAAVDWSYALLEPAERDVFDRLGVFPGGFDTAAAIAVAGDDTIGEWDVRDALASLVNKSLVTSGRGADGHTRYGMLETLRAYARERLDTAEITDRYRRQHAERYATFAEQAGPGLLGAGELAWRARVEVDLDNLRAAVTWGLDSDDDADQQLAIRIIGALAYESRNNRAAGVGNWALAAINAAEHAPPGLRCAVLAAAATELNSSAMDFDAAAELAARALDGGLPADCPAPALPFLQLTIAAGLRQAQQQEAETPPEPGTSPRDVLEQAIRQLQEVGADPASISALHALWARRSQLRVDDGPDQVVEHALSAVSLARQAGNPSALADGLLLLARGSWWQGDGGLARSAIAECLALVDMGARGPEHPMELAVAAVMDAEDGLVDRALLRLRQAVEAVIRANAPLVNRLLIGDNGTQTLLNLREPAAAAVCYGILTSPSALIPTAALKQVAERVRARLEAARAELGPEAFDREVARGQALAPDEIIPTVLSKLDAIIARRSGSAG